MAVRSRTVMVTVPGKTRSTIAFWIHGLCSEIAHELDLRLQLHPETFRDPASDVGDQPTHILGARSRSGHDEIGVFLGDLRPANPQPLRARGLHQAGGVIP